MIKIEEYIKLNQNERQKHLKLDESCIERGGISTNFKGVLAQYLNTTIPFRKRILLCHACNNEKCSNPKHLYWGTDSENVIDAYKNGAKNIWERTIEKYGDKKAREITSKNSKGKSFPNHMTEEEIENRIKSISDIDLTKWGWISKVSKRWNVSHTQVRRFFDKYYKGNTYKRN